MARAVAVAEPIPRRFSAAESVASHWFAVFIVIYGLWIWLPWLAPVLMHAGWTAAGRAVYTIYSIFCHQLPERSFFLFGEQSMYSLSEIQSAWRNTIDPMTLRQFVGNASLGWKVAWSDRMTSFYGSIWLFAIAWRSLRRSTRPIPLWAFCLLLTPMVLDGGSHAVSDLAGIGQGFRDTNLWLAGLTAYSLPASFYAGDVLGSFNSWMRLLTGAVAGLGIVLYAFPFVEASCA